LRKFIIFFWGRRINYEKQEKIKTGNLEYG
jgi:hypothetical protein